MTDEFQQYKGLLGQVIAGMYLEYVKKWKIVGEELKIERLDSRARIDMVAASSLGEHFPVEVKFQEYNIERYGVAFEHILEKIGCGETVEAVLNDEITKVRLVMPVLFLWYPPSYKIVEIPFYDKCEVIIFEYVLSNLRKELGVNFTEQVGERVRKKVIRFFETHYCTLTASQKQILKEIYPHIAF